MKKLLNGLLIGVLSFSFISTTSAASNKEEPQKKELYLLCGVLADVLEHANRDGRAPNRFIEQKLKNLPADRVKAVKEKFARKREPDGMATAFFIIFWYLNNEIIDALQNMPPLSSREAEDIRHNWMTRLKYADNLFSEKDDENKLYYYEGNIYYDNVAYINTLEFIWKESLMLKQKGVDLKKCGESLASFDSKKE